MAYFLTYTLADLLMFSATTYQRQIEIYNDAIWPAQIAGLAIAGLILWRLRKPGRASDRAIAGLLGLCWLWVGLVFHLQRHSAINWAAELYGWAFLFQAGALVLLGALGLFRLRPLSGWSDRAAFCLFLLAVIGVPLVQNLAGRGITEIEYFGVLPDPTAAATLALLALGHGRGRWLLAVIPVLWCLVAGLTAWGLGLWSGLVGPGAGVLALTVMVLRRR